MAEGGRGVAGPTRFACVRPPPARRTEDRGRAGSAAPPQDRGRAGWRFCQASPAAALGDAQQ